MYVATAYFTICKMSHVTSPFNLILGSCGINVSEASKSVRILQLTWIVVVVASEWQSLYYACTHFRAWKLAWFLSFVTYYICSMAFHVVCYRRRNLISRFLNGLICEASLENKMTISKMSKRFSCAYLFWSVYQFLGKLLLLYSYQHQTPIQIVIDVIEVAISATTIWIPRSIFVYVYFVKILWLLESQAMQKLSDRLKTKTVTSGQETIPVSAEDVFFQMYKHERRMDLLYQILHDLLSFVPFLTILFMFIAVPGMITQVFSNDQPLLDFIATGMVHFMEIGLCIWSIIVISRSWKETVDHKRDILTSLLLRINPQSNHVQSLLQDMSRRIERRTPFAASLGLFCMEETLIVSFGSAIITFSVLFLQLQQQYEEFMSTTTLQENSSKR